MKEPAPARLRKLLRRWRRRPRWGNLLRTRPFSDRYGYDRGTPVDRALAMRFLEEQRHLFRGHALEVGDDTYVRTFRSSITAVDIVDVNEFNPRATIVTDLGIRDSLLGEAYDLVLIAQTLQYVADVPSALRNCWHAVRPGGALLVTVPAIARIDPAAGDGDLWRFTPAGLRRWLSEAAPGALLDVRGLGNLAAAVAFLYGIAAEELPGHVLAFDDDAFPVLTAAAVTKGVQHMIETPAQRGLAPARGARGSNI